jgi:hypothetical protein
MIKIEKATKKYKKNSKAYNLIFMVEESSKNKNLFQTVKNNLKFSRLICDRSQILVYKWKKY